MALYTPNMMTTAQVKDPSEEKARVIINWAYRVFGVKMTMTGVNDFNRQRVNFRVQHDASTTYEVEMPLDHFVTTDVAILVTEISGWFTRVLKMNPNADEITPDKKVARKRVRMGKWGVKKSEL